MNAIPTTYKWIRFRSRLEAQWAAFFDEILWDGLWEYEPMDFNGYIPDFVLNFKTPLFVEVKPALTVEELEPALKKALESGCPNILCLKAFPTPAEFWLNALDIGMIQDAHSCESDLAVLRRCQRCSSATVISHYGGWECRKCGAWDGQNHLGDLWPSFTKMAWGSAKSSAQWMP